ncbi:MAG: cell envelope integrity protein TolA [Burkholderiales bacterium]|nr:cell envelope integrity protein TolA [Burkholderiales bacterium]
MHAPADRFEFAPPPPPGLMRAFSLAVVAHLLLLAALTWGVSWKRDAQTPAVEAELWSAVPQQAAPKLVEAPPEPETKPAPPPPPPKAEPVVSQADIALAREKERKAKEKLEQEQREREREKEKLAQLKREQEKRERDKLEREKKLAEEKKQKELDAKKDKLKEQQDAEKLKKMREENLKRMAGLAGATGGPSSTGTALKSSGPSASYAGRIIGRIKPNIVFTEDISGNPVAEVEVRTAPDGTIVGRKILKSSGVKAWDDAVLKAIDKTEVLPRDTDGRVPPSLVITFRPRD